MTAIDREVKRLLAIFDAHSEGEQAAVVLDGVLIADQALLRALCESFLALSGVSEGITEAMVEAGLAAARAGEDGEILGEEFVHRILTAALSAPNQPAERGMDLETTKDLETTLRFLSAEIEGEHLFSDAIDAATTRFHQTQYAINKNTERAGEEADGEMVLRASLRAAIANYVVEPGNLVASALARLSRSPGWREPDYIYDPAEWEYTTNWSERVSLIDDTSISFGDIHEFGTLIEGPKKYAARVVRSRDVDGNPDDDEVQLFNTRAEAEAAMDAPALPTPPNPGEGA